jgi:hypothetical protein
MSLAAALQVQAQADTILYQTGYSDGVAAVQSGGISATQEQQDIAAAVAAQAASDATAQAAAVSAQQAADALTQAAAVAAQASADQAVVQQLQSSLSAAQTAIQAVLSALPQPPAASPSAKK